MYVKLKCDANPVDYLELEESMSGCLKVTAKQRGQQGSTIYLSPSDALILAQTIISALEEQNETE